MKVAKKSGKIPDTLLNEPELYPHLIISWDAFLALNKSRGSTEHGPSPFSIIDIHSYINMIEIDDVDDKLSLLRNIQALDESWMDHQMNAQKQKREKAEEQKAQELAAKRSG